MGFSSLTTVATARNPITRYRYEYNEMTAPCNSPAKFYFLLDWLISGSWICSNVSLIGVFKKKNSAKNIFIASFFSFDIYHMIVFFHISRLKKKLVIIMKKRRFWIPSCRIWDSWSATLIDWTFTPFILSGWAWCSLPNTVVGLFRYQYSLIVAQFWSTVCNNILEFDTRL